MSPPSLHTSILKIITEHFAAFSAIATAFGFIMSSVFVYSYLSVFDWRLIWFVDTSDLLKFALIGVSIFIISSFILINIVDLAHSIDMFNGKKRIAIIIFVITAIIIIFFAILYLDALNNNQRLATRFLGASIIATAFLLIFRSKSWLLAFQTRRLREQLEDVADVDVADWPDSKTAALDFALVTLLIAMLGALMGLMTKEGEAFRVRVTLESESLDYAGLVMFTLHHAVFTTDAGIVIIPAERIRKIDKVQIR